MSNDVVLRSELDQLQITATNRFKSLRRVINLAKPRQAPSGPQSSQIASTSAP